MEPNERSTSNIAILGKFFKKNDYIESQSELHEEKTIHLLFKKMRFCQIAENDPVFEYDDEGHLFYIVMEGEVGVCIPGPVILEGENASPIGLFRYLTENFNDIHWPKFEDSGHVKYLIEREF